MKTKILILLLAAGAYCGDNGGGNMTAFEKADAVYRSTSFMGLDEYHAGMVGKFYINSAGKPSLSFGHMHVDPFKNWTGTIDGVAVSQVPTGTSAEGASDTYCGISGLGGDFRVRKMELSIDPAVLHTKAATDVLGKALIQRWGYDNGTSGSGSSTACSGSGANSGTGTSVGDFIYRGAFQTNTGLATATVRDNILDEGFINIAKAAHTVNYGWTGPDLVDYVWYTVYRYYVIPVPYTYFRDLYDAEDTRCDFLPEWSNEKSGVPVWGADATLKWINGGSTDNADYHNDFKNTVGGYTLDEYSAWVESGDFTGNNRDSRQRTTFRPSVVAPPIIRNFLETTSGPKLEIEENASTYVYYSIELFNSSTGAFVAYAKDANGADYKYRQLFLSQNLGASRSQLFYPTVHSSQNWGAYQVKVVVTDEGANTSDKTYIPLPGSVVPPNPVITSLYFDEVFGQSGCYPGSLQKIYGTNFNPLAAGNLILMNGATLVPTSSGTDADGFWLGVNVPGSVRTGDVKVSVDGRVSNAKAQRVAPVITGISANEARVGDLVTITGIDMVASPDDLFLNVSGANFIYAPMVENTPTRISFRVPDGATWLIAFWIKDNGWTSQLSVRNFIVKPVITSATQYPTRNGIIVIKGTGFSMNSTARLGTTNLATTYIDSHTMKAKVPANYPLGVDALTIYTRLSNSTDNCGPLVLESTSSEDMVKVIPSLTPILSLLLQ